MRTETRHGRTYRSRLLGSVALALAPLGSGASCLPADTRPPAGSILLTVGSEDEPSVTTEDGWSITVDRFLIGLGDAMLGPGCGDYGNPTNGPDGPGYLRLLDARRPGDQKLNVLYGVGQCYFGFLMHWPSANTVLGAGVSEADRQLMGGREPDTRPGDQPNGVALDFAATVTRGAETKRVHWMFRQATTYRCARPGPDGTFELGSNKNLVLPITLRGVSLFSDDAGALRFDPMAAADDRHGNGDGEVTLDELGALLLKETLPWGPYGAGGVVAGLDSFEDYLYLRRLPLLVRFREGVECSSVLGFGGL